jgi:hypothetical protein
VHIVDADTLIHQGGVPDRGAVGSTMGRIPPGTTWLLPPGLMLFDEPRLFEAPTSVVLFVLFVEIAPIGIVLLMALALRRAIAAVSRTKVCARLVSQREDLARALYFSANYYLFTRLSSGCAFAPVAHGNIPYEGCVEFDQQPITVDLTSCGRALPPPGQQPHAT